MKKLFTILFILSCFVAGAQSYTGMTAQGYKFKRLIPDSTLHIPTFCGTPSLRSIAPPKLAAVAFDSCNHKFYVYDPKTAVWDTIVSAGDVISYFDTTIYNYITNITIDSIREGEEHLYFTTQRVRGSLYADAPILYDSSSGTFYVDTISVTGLATKHDLEHIDTAVIGVTGYMSGDTSIISIDKNGGGNNKIYLLDPGSTGSVYAASYASINLAVAAIGATSRNMIVSTPMTLTANLTIPANISLTILKGGSINTNSYTLAINGHFTAGRYQVFSGSGAISFGNGAVDAQFPEWDGAYNDGTHNTEGTNAFKIQYSRNLPISLGIGTYLVDSITTTNSNPLIMFGQKQKTSIIQLTATSATGISIGRKVSCEKSVLKDFSLLGTSSNYCGISLGGDSTNFIYTNFTRLDNLNIESFSGTNACGIRLNQVQELNINDCMLEYNYDNILRPNIGYVTSTSITGKRSYIGRALNRGFAAVGAIADITFRDIIFEGNIREGFYYNSNAANGSINIEDCYFEQNCTSGTGAISITGGGAIYHQPSIKLNGLDFHTNVNATIPVIYLQNVFGGEISKCNGLYASGGTVVGNNVRCHFLNNSSSGSAANLRTYYQSLLNSSISITADDYDELGKWFHIGTQDFNGNVVIDTLGSITLPSSGVIKVNESRAVSGAMLVNYSGGNGVTFLGRGGGILIDSMKNVRMDTAAILSVNQINSLTGSMAINYSGGNGVTFLGHHGAIIIDSSQNVRMDTTATLSVNQINSIYGGMFVNYSGGSGVTYLGRSGKVYIDAAGNLGAGTLLPTQALTISGKANYLRNPTMAASDSNTLTNKKYVDSVTALNSASLKVNISDTSGMLANYLSGINTNSANIASNTSALALKANTASPTFTTNITSPIIYGSASSGGTLTLGSTSHATKGNIVFGTSAYDEVNNRLGIGITTPQAPLEVSNQTNVSTGLWITANRTALSTTYNWRIAQNPSGTGYAFTISNGAAGTPAFSINSTAGTNAGNVGLGITAGSATAVLHIKAGIATAGVGAPLKFTAGTNLTTPEAGAVEFDGTNYFTTISTTRYILVRTLTGTAAPATTPAAVGIQFVDTTNKKVYVATGTASSADWTILN